MNRYLLKIDEALIKSYIKIQKSVNRICGCRIEGENFDTVEKNINDLYRKTAANMDMKELDAVMQDAFPHGMRSMIDYDSLISTGVRISEAVSAYAAHAEQPRQLSKIDFGPIFISEFVNSDFFKDSINTAYKMIQKESDRAGDKISEPGSGLCDIAELENDVNEFIDNPEYFYEKFTGWSPQKRVQYCKISQILCFLCACFIRPYIQESISLPIMALKVKKVRKMPQAGAEVTCKLKENIEAIILEDTIRYYRIAFIDDDGIKKEGYVAKDKLRLLNA